MLSAAAAEGEGIQALESVLERLAGWLRSGGEADLIVPAVSQADDRGIDRLFRQLVPDVTGRRSGHEIIHRLRRKWDLGHSLSSILGRVRDQVHALVRAARAGPRGARAARTRSSPRSRPQSVAALGELVAQLGRARRRSSRASSSTSASAGASASTRR